MTTQMYPTFGRRMIFSGLAIVLILCTFGIAWAQRQAAKKERIRELQQERLKVAQELVASVKAQFENGVVPLSELQNAARLHLEAELELCLTKEDRIRVHEDMVKIAETVHEQQAEQVRDGAARPSELLHAKLNLLKAQIELERAKASKD